jgi:tRNA nucleotidyltransferase (CCA-adding enzyme)
MAIRYADLIGADPYPASEPQAVENDSMNRFMHDEPDYDPTGQTEYNFFYGNGQLHVSPHHDHAELSGHAGLSSDHHGPMAAGFVTVDGGRATWHVRGNIALSGFSRVLKDYTKRVGWAWGGLTDQEGQPIDDSFAPKKSMLLRDNETGEDYQFVKQGNTAWVGPKVRDEMRAALVEAGLTVKIAEYPGGGNMNDMIINSQPSGGEDLEMFNHGKPLQPKREEVNPDQNPTGTFKCPECGLIFPEWGAYLLHRKGEEPEREFDDDGHFPEMDMDAPLRPHWHDREPTVMPLASVKEARRVEGFDLYAGLWGYDSDDFLHYGAFQNGEIVGYATVRPDSDPTEVIMAHVVRSGKGIGTALLNELQRHYPRLYSHAISDRGDALMTKVGFVKVGDTYKWAAGQEGKDMIDAPLPFIFDIDADKIFVGHPGTRTSDIPGKFTPGGIVEGEYAPGGKVTITTETNMPWTARHMLDLWKWSVPHMDVTSLELMDATGNKTKLASQRTAQDVGQYVKQVAATYPAAWAAYQALRKAGGRVSVVGGAVRDALMNQEPRDIDLMVSGLPPEVVHNTLDALPGRMDLTGKNFGVYRYNWRGDEVEVALPRTEESTGDRRVDFKVKVDPNLPIEDDLLRRDFTGNAAAVDLDSGRLIDPHGAAHDIEHGILRTTHPNSFAEDPTRLLRALVMNGRYGWTPDERTRAEIREHAGRLPRESWDAMRPIMDKLFKSKNPAQAIRLAHETGLLQHIFPEVEHGWNFDQHNPYHKHVVGDHLMNVLEGVSRQTDDPDLRLAGLLHDIGKPYTQVLRCMDCNHTWIKAPESDGYHCPNCGSANTKGTYHGGYGLGRDHAIVGGELTEARLRHMSYPVSRMKRVKHLVDHHMFPEVVTAKGARKFLHNVGDDHANDLLILRQADHGGKGAGIEWEEAKAATDRQRGLIEQARSAQSPVTQSALSVNGNDLIQIRQALTPGQKVAPGAWVGEVLRRLTDDVIEDPRLNDRNALLERAHEYIQAIP